MSEHFIEELVDLGLGDLKAFWSIAAPLHG